MKINRLTKTRELTVLSQKGQVVLPKALRDAHGWQPGQKLSVESVGDSLSLRPVEATRSDAAAALLGCTGYRGPKRSLADMEKAIRKGAKGR